MCVHVHTTQARYVQICVRVCVLEREKGYSLMPYMGVIK